MIDAAQRARIRRLFYAEHWKVGTISRELGVHHDAVRHAIESDRFVSGGALVRPTMLDPYKGLVAKILDEYPRLRATRLYQMLRPRVNRAAFGSGGRRPIGSGLFTGRAPS